jgi:HlyD family secretion protein
VRSLGRLVPGHGIVNVGGAAGAVVSRLLVTPGQVVKTAEVLAYLDTHAERVAEVNIARSRLGHTRETRAAELAAAEAAVGQARVQGERAEAVGPLQVAVQRSKVRALEVQVASALRDVERLDALRQEKNVSQQEYDRQKLVLDATREELGGAVALLAQLESQHACTVKEAQAQLRAALAQVDRVRSTYALEPVEMELKAAEARVERSLVKAPLDGQVLSVHTWPGETVGAAPVVRVGAVSRMYAVAEVYETDVHRVRVGQRATVRSPALPVELPGVVEEVGVTVSRNDVTGIDPGAATDTRVVEVRIRLQHNDVATRFNNLQVDVEIEAQ